jgi:hypothetical protein
MRKLAHSHDNILPFRVLGYLQPNLIAELPSMDTPSQSFPSLLMELPSPAIARRLHQVGNTDGLTTDRKLKQFFFFVGYNASGVSRP